jgi:hypothetical protein
LLSGICDCDNFSPITEQKINTRNKKGFNNQ